MLQPLGLILWKMVSATIVQRIPMYATSYQYTVTNTGCLAFWAKPESFVKSMSATNR